MKTCFDPCHNRSQWIATSRATLVARLSLSATLLVVSVASMALADDATAINQGAAVEQAADDGQLALPPKDGGKEAEKGEAEKGQSIRAITKSPGSTVRLSERKDYTIHYSLVYKTYEEGGETKKLRGDFYHPRGTAADEAAGPLPVVLLLHGGAWRTGSKVQMLLHAKKLARRGYASFAVSYRFAPRHKFPAQAHDAKAAVRWLRENAEHYNVDPNRIAAYGYSAGAHLACLLGTTDPSQGLEGPDIGDGPDQISSRVQAVVGGGSPCDFRSMPPDEEFLTYFLGGTRSQKAAAYRLASPATHITADDPPMFFFHGEEDWLVPIHSPKSMMRRLEEVGVRTELHVCEGKGHVNTFADDPSAQAAIDFLDSVFKPDQNHQAEPDSQPSDDKPTAEKSP